ncbi:hypothetical protein [Thermanaerovibrio acidaminovorans]|uniref:Uncharacterized protein n=1 Tax=Thermanaerovibrio acidaminovorans (strain ATCC 49978 / DSM 6589 / Su883) TaxID=525903 RepID=D1B707_THEAS|nr:hypothetical protein [Thermanaerovibrio acidaminovorans]ACZ19798.1 hypothetical protein Taci_1577 [Thermanaerovibrio acidaminovorans DSM 6589]
MLKVNLLRNRDDHSNPYVRAIVRFAQRNLGDMVLFDEIHQDQGPFVMDRPTILIRPFASPVCFPHPAMDLEGYSTYFTEHPFHVPPVVSAVIRHLEDSGQLRDHHGVAGSGIGLFLAKALKARGVRVTLLGHRDLEAMTPGEMAAMNVINCTVRPFDGCVVNLSENPREVSVLTVRFLYRNLMMTLEALPHLASHLDRARAEEIREALAEVCP